VIVKLKPGQRALVTADAVEKTTYEGRVTEIRNTAKKEGDVNVFGVKIILTNADERLRPGMTAKAKIETERRQGVLRIPIQAVTTRERKKLEEESKIAAKIASAAGSASQKPAGTGSASSASGSSTGSARTSPAGEGGASGSAGAKTETAAQTSSGAGPPDAGAVHDAKASPSGASPAAKGDRDELEVCYRIEGDIARVAPVRTGSSDEKYVEVLEGLKEKDTVVKGPYRILKKLKDGDRVVKKEETEAGGEAGGKSGTGDEDAF
jgi:multidrug efflux pump subunit AcrA (membrane-fusion protein)